MTRTPPDADEYSPAELDDLTLSVFLLAGVWTHRGAGKKKADQFPGKRYLSGAAETQARKAIGRLLRNTKRLDPQLRLLLAELFDGNGPHQSPDSAPMVRKIDFRYLSAGQPDEITLRDAHLAATYQSFIKAGMVPKAARYEVGKIFDKSDTIVKTALRNNPILSPPIRTPHKAVKKKIDRPR